MRYYPAFIDIENKPVLVVGGGAVAGRKVKRLVECGASITVVAPLVTDYLLSLEADRRITVHRRPYAGGDVEGFFLVIAATDRKELNMQVYSDAVERNILINTVDRPAPGGFISPAVIERGDVVFALSSSGASPLFIKQLKDYFERKLYSRLKEELSALSALRNEILSRPDLSEVEKASELRSRIQPKIDIIMEKIERQ